MDQDDPFKQIKAPALQPDASSNASALSTHLSPARIDAEAAVDRARVLLGCYRKDDAADPETYATAVAAVLAEYPSDIVRRVTDPRSGLPATLQWLPSVKEVNDACAELEQRQRRFAEATARESEQLAARRAWIASREKKPTLEEMKAMYGDNWGLQTPTREGDAAKAKRLEQLSEANRKAFVAECEANGMSPDSPVSPSLERLIRAGMA